MAATQMQPTKSNLILSLSAVATASMAGKAYRYAKLVAPPAGAVKLLGFSMCGVGDEPDGVLMNEPAAGSAGTIEAEGQMPLELGGAVTAFDEVGPGADGVAIKYPDGQGYHRVLKTGVTGDVVSAIALRRRRQGGGVEANDAGDTLNKYAFLHKVTIGSAGAEAATLPSGAYVGQEKIIQATVVGSGTWVLTGAFLTNVTATTTATFNAVGDRLRLVWDGAAWFVLENTSVTLA